MEWLASAPYSQRLMLLIAADAAVAVYILWVVMPQAAGRKRLIASAPIVLVNCLLPLLFTTRGEVPSLVAAAFNNCWLVNFKVAALALARGPLTQDLSPVQFAIVLLAPVTPQLVEKKSMSRVGSRGRLDESGGSAGQLMMRSFTKGAALVAVVAALTVAPSGSIMQDALYALGMYTFLGTIMDGPASALTSMVGLNIAPHFNAPFLSESVSSFWGSRWNLTASNTLRFLVYDPICDGSWVASPPERLPARATRALRAMAACACFIVSGLMHEVMFWYASAQGWARGVWFLFFAVQGPLVLVEAAIHRQLRLKQISIPPPARVAIALTVLMTTAHFLFFPPAVQSGVAANVSNTIYKDALQLQQWLKSFVRA